MYCFDYKPPERFLDQVRDNIINDEYKLRRCALWPLPEMFWKKYSMPHAVEQDRLWLANLYESFYMQYTITMRMQEC